ncbi:MAG: DMT family transporter [Paracoccaceae bacterium]|nr:DMT family transporter [Paracoccaceae bacterium]
MNRSNPKLAAVYMIGAIVSFTLMAIAGRELGGSLDTFEIMMYRSIIGILIMVTCITYLGRWGDIHRRRMPLHLFRNAAHFTGQNLWFYAVTLIPLAQLFALEFTVPIWVALAAPLFLGESFTRTKSLAIGLGFIGILIVTRPGSMGLSIGIIAAATAAIAFAITAITTKKLTQSENILTILFWLTILQAVFGALCAGFDGVITWPSGINLFWVTLVGCAGLLAHFSLTRALHLAPASVVTPMDFARLPVVAVVGAMLYAEPLDPIIIFGAVVIFAANYINIRSEMRSTSN